jgi:hypothetical protein
MADVKITSKVDRSRLKKKLREFKKSLSKPLGKELPLYVTWFTQSVVKATPPKGGKGKRIQKARPIVRLDEPIYSAEDKRFNKFLVPIRGKRRLTRYTATKTEANRLAKITYRFIGKFGWLASADPVRDKTQNVKLPKLNPEVRSLRTQLAKSRVRLKTDKPFIVIINTVKGIARYARLAAIQALKTTERRIIGVPNKRKVKSSYSKLWKKII